MTTAIALTKESFNRFDRASRHSEQISRMTGQQSRVSSGDLQLPRLKVISGTVTSDGYPAYVQHTTDNGATWSDYDANYVRLLSPTGAALTVGTHYRAICVGVNSSSEVCYHTIADTATGGLTGRKNSTGSTFGPRSRLNVIEGNNIALTLADDSGNDELDFTVAAKVAAAYNGGSTVGPRNRLNFIASGLATISVADDAGNDEIDVTIGASYTPPAATTSEAISGGDVNITPDNNWMTTGMSLTLAAGTWLIMTDVSCFGYGQDNSGGMAVDSYGSILCRLYNTTDGAITGTQRVVCVAPKMDIPNTSPVDYLGDYAGGCATICKVVTLAASRTIRVDVQRVTSAADFQWIVSDFYASYSCLTALKLF